MSGLPRRLPFEPLEELAAERFVRNPGTSETPLSLLGHITGHKRQQLGRWKREGIPWYWADRIAIQLQIHPVVLWPDWYEVAA